MARPRKKIDIDEFKKLCERMCTLSEIAWWFNCSEDTIERWCHRELQCGFSEALKRYSARAKIDLRKSQFELAKRSPEMAIFLGKVYLGQKEPERVMASLERGLADLIAGLREPAEEADELAE